MDQRDSEEENRVSTGKNDIVRYVFITKPYIEFIENINTIFRWLPKDYGNIILVLMSRSRFSRMYLPSTNRVVKTSDTGRNV